jgi:protein involved in polysaccharide export with SLBB domain/capsular polysaccharide biosynthesis protein
MNVGHDVNLSDTDSLGARIPASERSRPSGTKRRSTPPEEATQAPQRRKSPKAKFSVDPMSLLQPALRRWPWLFFGTVLAAGLGLALGMWLWKMSFSSATQMVKYDPPVANDAFRPRPIDTQTLIGRLEDPAFLRRVGQQMTPKMTSSEVLRHMKVMPEKNSGIMNVIASGLDAGETTMLANVFAREIVKFTQELQAQEAAEAAGYVAKDLHEAETQLVEAQKNLPRPVSGSGSSAEREAALEGLSPVAAHQAERIQAAKDELSKLLAKYTDAHPLVRQQRATIAALEAEASTGLSAPEAKSKAGATAATSPDAKPAKIVSRDEFEIALFRVRELESMRMQLQYRRQQIEAFKANPPGAFRITVPASGDTLSVHRPWVKVGLLTGLFAMLGFTAAASNILVREFMDRRLKTLEDVERVTGLPVIATLGDIRQMSMAERDDWAFRTWIALQDKLSFSPNHGLICGVTSSQPGDGRSTWIGMLAGAARKCGFRVLTIATKPTADASVNAKESAEAAAAAEEAAAAGRNAAQADADASANGAARVVDAVPAAGVRPTANGAKPNGVAPVAPAAVPVPSAVRTSGIVIPRASEIETLRGVSADSEFTALTASALFTPAQVTEKLMGPDNDPLVHIPLPGWTWNLERRKQWQGALTVWRKIENVVILVELPPASVPEAVLLASNLPNILWLVESGKSDAGETRAQLQTLRHARCNLVGSVINRAMSTFTQGRLSRWMSCIAVLAAVGLSGTSLLAQTAPATDAATTPATFSVTSPAQRAEWQKRLTLGPGDVLTIGLYGEPELTAKEVPIGPDGRISYLEATDIVAAGLTVDELRDRLNDALGKFRREPQAIVIPMAYKSKKYYVLGKVNQRGVFTLDRPTTLLEAVARSRGMETGMGTDQNLVELTDLSHSFIARRGQKLQVDFEKLFENGDLTQNIALEPDDYIYFPAAEMKEVYVLGAVLRPGSYAYTTATGALGAIAARGGFGEYAYRSKIVVIRGSLQHPQSFVIDANDVLSGKAADMKLQPHDIVYVSKRPFWRAEDLLDEAASAFVTSATVVWTGLHVDAELHR